MLAPFPIYFSPLASLLPENVRLDEDPENRHLVFSYCGFGAHCVWLSVHTEYHHSGSRDLRGQSYPQFLGHYRHSSLAAGARVLQVTPGHRTSQPLLFLSCCSCGLGASVVWIHDFTIYFTVLAPAAHQPSSHASNWLHLENCFLICS